ncbi:hypothetical protein HZC21_05270 [Candidatus Peregrinibacteria bacterium]|nr:hypothetical protein [Candidatus Peregrinibacteria bacterium]
MGKNLSEVQWAYIAGFLDGDGAVMATIESHQEKRFGFRVRITIKVTQYHQKDVEWLACSTGIGYIRSNKKTYEWIVRDQKAAAWLITKLRPYIRCKRRQMEIAEQIMQKPVNSKNELINIAQLADTLSSFNVRSRNRRRNFAIMIQESFSRND